MQPAGLVRYDTDTGCVVHDAQGYVVGSLRFENLVREEEPVDTGVGHETVEHDVVCPLEALRHGATVRLGVEDPA